MTVAHNLQMNLTLPYSHTEYKNVKSNIHEEWVLKAAMLLLTNKLSNYFGKCA